MRFDTPIYMQRVREGEYDPDTGDYADDTLEETCVYANVNDTGADTLRLVYGEIRQGSLTIRLQNHYKKPFSRIRVGDKRYCVDLARKLRTKHVFIVSEVQ